MTEQLITINAAQQIMLCYDSDQLKYTCPISTGKKGLGEKAGSECTPRGWHRIYSRLGLSAEVNSVFVGRVWTGEIYSDELAEKNPGRDWILTRILQLEGIEPGRNKGSDVDSLTRYIYIHGTPDSTELGKPGSHGCIRMRNSDLIQITDWVKIGALVFIH